MFSAAALLEMRSDNHICTLCSLSLPLPVSMLNNMYNNFVINLLLPYLSSTKPKTLGTSEPDYF